MKVIISKGFPLLTLGLSGAACLLLLLPATPQLGQYDRVAIDAGQGWRLFTSHWTHWSVQHCLWNVAVFCGLGVLCERYGRRAYVTCLVLAAPGISLSLLHWQPAMEYYRGLSGLASTLFLYAATRICLEAWARQQWVTVWAALFATTSFVGKIVVEMLFGESLFVETAGLFSPVPLAHFSGGLFGVVAGLVFSMFPRKSGTCPPAHLNGERG